MVAVAILYWLAVVAVMTYFPGSVGVQSAVVPLPPKDVKLAVSTPPFVMEKLKVYPPCGYGYPTLFTVPSNVMVVPNFCGDATLASILVISNRGV